MESELPAELIHKIQSFVSEKDAGGTCTLSKSWLHAWYTIPHLRFHKNKLIGRTLERYHRHNLPIQSLNIRLKIENHDTTAPLITCWIRQVASKSCLKKLSLSLDICIDSFTLPDEILSGENLTRIDITNEADRIATSITGTLWICNNNNMIKCMSLRVLKLQKGNIIDMEVLNSLLSSCIMLEKIQLDRCNGLKTVKVKDLPRLVELELTFVKKDCFFQIDNVPSLVSFHYEKPMGKWVWEKPIMNHIVNVTRLQIHGLGEDSIVEFFHMMKSKFVFLDDLEVGFAYWCLNNFSLVITSGTLKRLSLHLNNNKPNNIQVNAPKLVYFSYESNHTYSLVYSRRSKEN